MHGSQADSSARGSDSVPGYDLVIDDLWVSLDDGPRRTDLVRGLSLELPAGESLGLVGPSGSGKTTAALAILGLPPGGRGSIRSGSIRLGERELTVVADREYRQIRGGEIGLIFQDPVAGLTPVRSIGNLIGETLREHLDIRTAEIEARTNSLLEEVGFDDPSRIAASYAHQLSGGMCQRAMIALALAGEPSVLIADEPTASLDAIARDEILTLLESVRQRRSLSILTISHDPAVIRRIADRVVSMQDPVLLPDDPVAERSAEGVFVRKEPPTPEKSPQGEPALTLRNLDVSYTGRGQRNGAPPALKGVSLQLWPGKILGLVGQSGSGKTTVARSILRLIEPTAGQILLGDQDITHLGQRQLRPLRPQMAAVFQNPGSSLNPRHTVGRILEQPLLAGAHRTARSERRERAAKALESVELEAAFMTRRPRELSGGQQQRVALARALIHSPQILVCDEPFTGLDHPLRDQLTGLLLRLQRDRGLACLFIAHNLELIARIADRVAVMKDGRIIESGPTEQVLKNPEDRFTRSLVEASD